MRIANTHTFTLNNFEGPLDFLLQLVQKNEIDIHEIFLQEILKQFSARFEEHPQAFMEDGAEFIGITAALLFLKSKLLLPKHDQSLLLEEQEPDPRFDIIHQLLDYCRFKDMAKVLVEREDSQGAFFMRGIANEIPIPKKNLGIEHLSLTDLELLFKEVLTKSTVHKGLIQEETWLVSDKIHFIREQLKEMSKINFLELFSSEQPREELIVIFLAILELMKMEELCVVREKESDVVYLYPHRNK